MSYGTNLADMFHQVGVYTGSILKGAKPADLAVLQSNKIEPCVDSAIQADRPFEVYYCSGLRDYVGAERMSLPITLITTMFAAVQESVCGTKRRFVVTHQFGRYRM
jgi:hypothetical protein